jgi:hypothetical protein
MSKRQMSPREPTKKKRNLVEVVERIFPGEDEEHLSQILSHAAERGKIRYEEIEMQEAAKVDLLLLLEKERVLIPFKTSKSMAWEDRVLNFRSGEVFEMPHVIIHLIRRAEETGEWDPDYAVKTYLREIGEEEPEKIVALIERIKPNVKRGKVTPKILLDASEELDLRSKIGTIIAVLKGGGIISPCLRKPSSLRYEINPSLMK